MNEVLHTETENHTLIKKNHDKPFACMDKETIHAKVFIMNEWTENLTH